MWSWRTCPRVVVSVLLGIVGSSAVAVAGSAFITVVASPAAADPPTQVPVVITNTLRFAGPPSSAGGGGSVSAHESPLFWKALGIADVPGATTPPAPGPGAPCDVPPALFGGPPTPGHAYLIELWDRATNAVATGSQPHVECVPDATPGGALAGLAQPPTYEAVMQALVQNLDAPTLAVTPAVRGLTGLDTLADAGDGGPAVLQRTITVNGWSVTATMTRAAGYVWTLGGTTATGAAVDEVFSGDTFQHRFTTKGDYTLAVESRWEITEAAMTGAGVTATVSPLGTVYLGSQRDYPVVEARAVLHSVS
jgi:hypothetical protein